MTIDLTDNAPRVSYSVSQGATTTSFAVPFEFFDTTDLKVVVDGTTKTITSHYTVSGGDGSTGTVTMSVTGATGGSTVIIYREIPLSRTTDFPASGAFPISTLNTELDRTVALFDDRKDRIDRSIRLLDTDDAATMTLPVKASRVGTVLGFNATTGAVEAGPTIANVNSLADITTNINTVAGISSNVTTVAGIQANVTTVAGISSNVSTVAGISSNVTTVAGKASLITSDFAADMALIDSTFVTKMALVTSDFITDMSLVTADFVSDVNTLATSDIVSDLNTLATSDIVTDLNTLATADIVSDLNTLATSDIVSDLNQLATSDFVSDLNAVEGIKANVTTVAGVSSNVTTVAGISSNVTTVAGISANVTTVAGANSNITTVASNITGVNSFAERYRVGSSDPSSSLDEGDLFYNSTSNALKYYNGSSWQGITPVTTGISSGNVPVFTSGAADNDFLRIDGTSIEGRSASEVLSDIGGQASLTFGISNTNAVKIDSSSVADDEYARFTANGLESRSTSEVLSDIGGIGTSGGTFSGDVIINSDSTTLPSVTGDGNEAPLQVYSTEIDSANLWDDINSDGNNYSSMPSELAIYNLGNNTTNSFAGIFMQPGETSNNSFMNAARIAAIREGAGRQTAIGFACRENGGDMVEVARFSSTGNLGVGTNSPTAGITLEGADGTTNATMMLTTTSVGSAGLACDANGLNLGASAGGFVFKTGATANDPTDTGTERIRLGTSGQIGIAGANYGTSGQVLTSGGASGAVSWADAGGGGGLVPLVHTNITSATAAVEYTMTSYTDYDNFFIAISNLISDGNADSLKVQIMRVGETTYQDMDYYRALTLTTSGFTHNDGAGSFIFFNSGATSTNYQTMAIFGYMFDLHSTTNVKTFNHRGSGYSGYSANIQNSFLSHQVFANGGSTQAATQKIKYRFTSNDIKQGKFTLYGMAKP
tara:strand:+ start:2159 stop:4990 length:2832 start_codon:yes stop_codon:yes gene_type:complete